MIERRPDRLSRARVRASPRAPSRADPPASMNTAACFLVVAHSARLLAQSAARGAHPVCALDLFHDRDTDRYALAAEAVQARCGDWAGFDGDDLVRRADRLCPPRRCLGLVYGAGFEDDTPTLTRLASDRTVLGNPPELVGRLKDPAAFFGLLDRLAIDHPQTSLQAPPDRRGWLYKRRGATGGAHVINAVALPLPPPDGQGYYQRRCTGRSLSMLFLADGRGVEVVGISEQLRMRRGPHPYAYAGAIGPVPLPAALRTRLRERVAAIVRATGLIGCNSIDFLLDRKRALVLEINPRPSATMDLYDADWPDGLFDAHLRACRGMLPAPRNGRPHGRVRGHAIVTAASSVHLRPELAFPPWCSDLPRAGARFAAGAPVCTVHADGAAAQAVRRQLGRRRRQMEAALTSTLHSEDTEDGSSQRTAERESVLGASGCIAA